MPRFSLRTLLIVLAIGPPILGFCYVRWQKYKARRELYEMITKICQESEMRRRAWQVAVMGIGPVPAQSDTTRDD